MLNITIREMQIETAMRYHLTTVRMAMMKIFPVIVLNVYKAEEKHGFRLKMLILTRVLGLRQSIEIDQRLDKKSRESFTGAPDAAGGMEDK